MGGGRLRCFFTRSAVLLLGVFLHGVSGAEVLTCQNVVHKQVGDTVEFSSCLPPEGVISASWLYEKDLVADMQDTQTSLPQFRGRVHMNNRSFSLTVKNLSLQDSGFFFFLSEVEKKQRQTVSVTLQVHEPLPTPVLTFNSSWYNFNSSCRVSLQCSAASSSSFNFSWTVGNQSLRGSSLEYVIPPQDGETRFTCTISIYTIEQSASTGVTCDRGSATETGNLVWILIGAIGGFMMIVIIACVVVGVHRCHCKQRAAGPDTGELTVYADISDVAVESRKQEAMKPSSVYVYETIDDRANNTVTPGPQTVYDMIQFNHQREDSPYRGKKS